MKVELTPKQRAALLEWAAEGLQLPEIKERAAAFDPPWEATWLQLKWVRKKANVKYRKLLEDFDAEAMTIGLARKAVRIREKVARWQLLQQVIIERGKAADMQEVAGGRTGLMVKDYKGNSYNPVYKLDAALLKEQRELEKEIAIELGQWVQKNELSGPDGGAIPISISDAIKLVYEGGGTTKVGTELGGDGDAGGSAEGTG